MIPALTPPPVLVAPGFRRGTLDVNQVIGDTTAARLECDGRKTHDAGRDKVKMSVTASPLLSLLALVQRIVCILIICMSPSTTRQTAAFRPSVCRAILPHLRERRPLNHSGKVDTHNLYGTDSDYDDSDHRHRYTCVLSIDINDNTTIRNTTRWSRVKAGLPDDGDCGWGVEYYPAHQRCE